MNTKDGFTLRMIAAGVLVTSLLWFGIGVIVGREHGRDIMKREAVVFGTAYYRSATNTGEAVFTWRKECE